MGPQGRRTAETIATHSTQIHEIIVAAVCFRRHPSAGVDAEIKGSTSYQVFLDLAVRNLAPSILVIRGPPHFFSGSFRDCLKPRFGLTGLLIPTEVGYLSLFAYNKTVYVQLQRILTLI